MSAAPDIHPLEPRRDLSLSRRQMVEIAKALGRNPKILILDEATSALTASRRREGLRDAQAAARGRPRGRLHLAPHARDRGARRRLHGLPQRAAHRDLRGPHQDRRGDRRDDDRPRVQEHLSAAVRRRSTRSPPAVLEVRDLSWAEQLQGHHRCSVDRARSSVSAVSTARASASCCWRCSACCAASAARIEIDGRPVRIASPRNAKSPAATWR